MPGQLCNMSVGAIRNSNQGSGGVLVPPGGKGSCGCGGQVFCNCHDSMGNNKSSASITITGETVNYPGIGLLGSWVNWSGSVEYAPYNITGFPCSFAVPYYFWTYAGINYKLLVAGTVNLGGFGAEITVYVFQQAGTAWIQWGGGAYGYSAASIPCNATTALTGSGGGGQTTPTGTLVITT